MLWKDRHVGRPTSATRRRPRLSHVWIVVLLIAVAAGCSSRHENVVPFGSGESAGSIDSIVVYGATMVIRGGDTVNSDVLIEREGGRLVVRDISPGGVSQARDTIHIAGAYLHSANAFDQRQPRVGSHAMYVVRQGPSPGSVALGLIGARSSEPWRPLHPTENHPPGPPDERVGCYGIERGQWSDSTAVLSLRRGARAVPADVRLHWQYLWHVGREDLLVATDIMGYVPGEFTNMFAWWPRGDSVEIGFSTGFESASFRLVSEGDDLVGLVRLGGDTYPGPRAEAPVRLRRRVCRE